MVWYRGESPRREEGTVPGAGMLSRRPEKPRVVKRRHASQMSMLSWREVSVSSWSHVNYSLGLLLAPTGVEWASVHAMEHSSPGGEK